MIEKLRPALYRKANAQPFDWAPLRLIPSGVPDVVEGNGSSVFSRLERAADFTAGGRRLAPNDNTPDDPNIA